MDVNNLKHIVGSYEQGKPAVIRFFGPVEYWNVSEFNDEFLFLQEIVRPSKIIVAINSEGGSVIYGMSTFSVINSCPIETECVIEGIAASMGSIIWSAGKRLYMHDYSLLMIHNPFTVAMGDSAEMRRAIQLLDEVKESIINAYEIKTGLSRVRLSHLMDSETWMSAHKAKELGFCDEVLYTPDEEPDEASGFSFARRSAVVSLMNRVLATVPEPEPAPDPVPAPVEPDWHETKLNLLKYL